MRQAGVSEPPEIVGVPLAWDELSEDAADEFAAPGRPVDMDGRATRPRGGLNTPIAVDVGVPTAAGTLVARQPVPSPVAVEVADRYARALTLDVDVSALPAPRAPRRSRAAMRDRALRPTAGERERGSDAAGSGVEERDGGTPAPAPAPRPRSDASAPRRRSAAAARPARGVPQGPGSQASALRPRPRQATVAPPPAGPPPADVPAVASGPVPARRPASTGRPASAPARRQTSAPARRQTSAPARRPASASAPASAPASASAPAASSTRKPERPYEDPVVGPSGRRTVTIRGRGAERDLTWSTYQSHRRPELPAHERPGFRPDRAAMWAVLLGLILVLVAATSSHAAVLTHVVR